jgi:hypothetical protein
MIDNLSKIGHDLKKQSVTKLEVFKKCAILLFIIEKNLKDLDDS